MNYVLPLRIVQIFLALLVLALAAAAISKFEGSFSSLSFLLFCGIWGVLAGLSLVLLIPQSGNQAMTVWVVFAVEFVTMIFFFAGFIAVAAFVGTASCDITATFDYLGYFYTESISLPGYTTGCQCTKAAIAFGAFSWLAWLASFVLVCRQMYEDRYAVSRMQVQPEVRMSEPTGPQVTDAGTGLKY